MLWGDKMWKNNNITFMGLLMGISMMFACSHEDNGYQKQRYDYEPEQLKFDIHLKDIKKEHEPSQEEIIVDKNISIPKTASTNTAASLPRYDAITPGYNVANYDMPLNHTFPGEVYPAPWPAMGWPWFDWYAFYAPWYDLGYPFYVDDVVVFDDDYDDDCDDYYDDNDNTPVHKAKKSSKKLKKAKSSHKSSDKSEDKSSDKLNDDKLLR